MRLLIEKNSIRGFHDISKFDRIGAANRTWLKGTLAMEHAKSTRSRSPTPFSAPHRRRHSRSEALPFDKDDSADGDKITSSGIKNTKGASNGTAKDGSMGASLKPWGEMEAARCDGGDPDLELCEFEEIRKAPLNPGKEGVVREVMNRGRWLVGLLVLQSSSSFILDKYQELIKEHLVVTLFLTMLVGAGGNSGNQSAIKVIRGLATGSMKTSEDSIRKVMLQQISVGLLLGTVLAGAGWIRVFLTNGNVLNATAISMSLFLIVLTSVVAGTALPFGLARAGIDPANAGTSIQVLMDVVGVCITCVTCHFILDIYAKGLGITV